MELKTMKKNKFVILSGAIICLLLFCSHLVRFLGPALRYTDATNGVSVIPEDPDELDTAEEFMAMALYLQGYNFSEYSEDDFPEWLMMPTAAAVENNESLLVPFGAYNWSNYNPDDFPSFLDMPENDTDIDESNPEWILEYLDEEIKAELIEYAATYEDSGDESSLILPLIDFYELVYGLIFFVVALIFYWITRSIGGN
jgi:hypothetical protein